MCSNVKGIKQQFTRLVKLGDKIAATEYYLCFIKDKYKLFGFKTESNFLTVIGWSVAANELVEPYTHCGGYSMNLSNGIRVSDTRSNHYQKSCVRVYKEDQIIAEVYISVYQPLKYLIDRPKSKHVKELKRQIKDDSILQILRDELNLNV